MVGPRSWTMPHASMSCCDATRWLTVAAAVARTQLRHDRRAHTAPGTSRRLTLVLQAHRSSRLTTMPRVAWWTSCFARLRRMREPGGWTSCSASTRRHLRSRMHPPASTHQLASSSCCGSGHRPQAVPGVVRSPRRHDHARPRRHGRLRVRLLAARRCHSPWSPPLHGPRPPAGRNLGLAPGGHRLPNAAAAPRRAGVGTSRRRCRRPSRRCREVGH